jgi:hypothetical protein
MNVRMVTSSVQGCVSNVDQTIRCEKRSGTMNYNKTGKMNAYSIYNRTPRPQNRFITRLKNDSLY